MKAHALATLTLMLFVSSHAASVDTDVQTLVTMQSADQAVHVSYNCSEPRFDVAPTIVNGRSFVELNGLFNAMDIELEWVQAERRIDARRGDHQFSLWIGQRQALVNGETVSLDAAPFVAQPQNRTMVPLSLIAQATGASVVWDATLRQAMLADQACIQSDDWKPGLPSDWTLPEPSLLPLSLRDSDKPIWKSNNPETVEGTGWLMQTEYNDPSRGGRDFALSGCHAAYLFHINRSGREKHIHLMAINPRPYAIDIDVRGSGYNNRQQPLNGAGTGPSYRVAEDWLRKQLPVNRRMQIAPGDAVELDWIPLDSMVDGRYEICSDEPVQLYTVATSSGSVGQAVSATLGGPAAGFIAWPGPDRYGREAGVYRGAEKRGATVIDLPADSGHLGLAFNTSGKFRDVQDQTSPALMSLADSSDRSHGNYGQRYRVGLVLRNPHASSKIVHYGFASSETSANGPSFTYNGPALINGQLRTLFTTPSSPYQYLGQIELQPGQTRAISIDLLVPGLITTNQQLILEIDP